MYILIRIILGLVLGVGVYFAMKKARLKKKRLIRILSIIATIVLIVVMYFIPIENEIMGFTTPEKAFNYLYMGNVSAKIDAESSTMILYVNNNTNSQAIIPKKNNSWKLDVFQFKSIIFSKTINKRIFEIYNARNTKDYYVIIREAFAKAPIEITDSRGSKFQYIEEVNKSIPEKNIIYFTYVENLDNNYFVEVNGEKVYLIS